MKIVRRMIQIPYTFSLMNVAVVAGLFHYLGRHQEFWDLAQPASRRKPVTTEARHL